MSERENDTWSKYLKTGEDGEGTDEAPLSTIKVPKKTEQLASDDKGIGRKESLEDKIARVLAGINMPQRGNSSKQLGKAASKKAVTGESVNEAKSEDTSSPKTMTSIVASSEVEQPDNKVAVSNQKPIVSSSKNGEGTNSTAGVPESNLKPEAETTTNEKDEEARDKNTKTSLNDNETTSTNTKLNPDRATKSILKGSTKASAETVVVDSRNQDISPVDSASLRNNNHSDDETYENSVDGETEDEDTIVTDILEQPADSLVTTDPEKKMNLAELEEVEKSSTLTAKQTPPPPVSTRLKNRDNKDHSSSISVDRSRGNSMDGTRSQSRERSRSAGRLSTGKSQQPRSSLGSYLNSNSTRKPSSGASVNSTGGITKPPPFSPQQRRIPDMPTALSAVGYNGSVSPDPNSNGRNNEKWSVIKRSLDDAFISPSKSAEEHNTTVAVRIRPFMVGEIQRGPRRVVSVNGNKLILVNPNAFDADPDTIAAAAAAVSLENMRCNDWAKVFCFDHCLWSYDPNDKEDIYIDEEGVYSAVGENIVGDAMRGVSSCCFTYGHTGTGKTHTMLGNPVCGSYFKSSQDSDGQENDTCLIDSAGLAPRVFYEIVDRIIGDEELARDTRITVSFLEIYQERLRDCLVSEEDAVDLRIREHPAVGPYVENLSRVEVKSPAEALQLLEQGYSSRTTSSTDRNRNSSRSHAIATLELTDSNSSDPVEQLTSKNKKAAKQKHEHVRVQMVDLAGSEKEVAEEKPEEYSCKKGILSPRRGANFSEGSVEKLELKMIRRSLSTLGYIIKALGSGIKARGLPFRDSMLTWLLKDSLMGRSNTTTVATISPSHTCFDETLSTLKYAERLCNLGSSRKSGKEGMGRVAIGDTVDPPLTYTLTQEYSRLKKELGGGKHGSAAARHLLQQTVSDPQQRLARMESYQDNNSDNVSRISDISRSSNPHEPFRRPLRSNSLGPTAVGGYSDGDSSVVDSDLKEAYRQLHGKYVELQIELENARTDRDGMQLEMQSMQDKMERLSADRFDHSKTGSNEMTAALHEAENEVEELRGVVLRKDEAIERLINELAEERKAREVVEQSTKGQVTELIKRLEGLHRQGQEALQQADTWQRQAESAQAENVELQQELSELKEKTAKDEHDASVVLESVRKELQLTIKQHSAVIEERDKLQAEVADYANEKAQSVLRESSLTERNQELQVNLEKVQNDSKLKSELEVVKLQRDSLYDIIKQQEQTLQVQQQQSEASLKMLHQRQLALDRYEQRTGGDMEELTTLQDSLQKLLSNEGELLRSELVDARKMTEIIAAVKEKIVEADAMKGDLDHMQAEKTELQEAVDRLSQQKQSTDATLRSLNDQIDHLKKNAVDWETRAHYWQQTAQKNSKQGEDEASESARSALKATDDTDLRSENEKLRELLEFSQQEAANAKEELEQSKEDMQKEFSSLWLAVEQLNKLDASKDKEMADLAQSYDEACKKNAVWEEKYRAIVRDYDNLQRELQAIDLDLLDKADLEGIEVSALLNHTFSPSHNGYQDENDHHSAPRHRSVPKPPPSHHSRRSGAHNQESSMHTPKQPRDIRSHYDDLSHHSGRSLHSDRNSGHRNSSGEKASFLRRHEMKPDKRMSEKGLEDQIVELSQFLEVDSARFQSQQDRSRMRNTTNSSRVNKSS